MRKPSTYSQIQANYIEIKEKERAQIAAERKAELLKIGKESWKVNKTLGLRPLKGTTKQKAWAEKIRKDFLKYLMTDESFDLVCHSEMTSHSKFWIDTRKLDREKLAKAMHDLVVATAKANEIGSADAGYNEQIKLRQKALDYIQNHDT